MPSIQETWLKIKNWTDFAVGEWGLVLIVLLVALASFGFGAIIGDGDCTAAGFGHRGAHGGTATRHEHRRANRGLSYRERLLLSVVYRSL
jgi:hypothetical protein